MQFLPYSSYWTPYENCSELPAAKLLAFKDIARHFSERKMKMTEIEP